jgi:hypothetical protein
MPILSAPTLYRLHQQHKSLELLLSGFSDAQLRQQVIVGKWSIFENIVHLATYQHTFFKRIAIILQEDNRPFHRYSAESDPLFHDNLTRGTAAILLDLESKRENITAMLQGLHQEELQRVGHHPVYGKMDIQEWVEFFLLHEAHHLFTIFKLRAELRKGF